MNLVISETPVYGVAPTDSWEYIGSIGSYDLYHQKSRSRIVIVFGSNAGDYTWTKPRGEAPERDWHLVPEEVRDYAIALSKVFQ